MGGVRKISVDDSGCKHLTINYRDNEWNHKHRYIHKYYLSAEDKGKLLPVDLVALEESLDEDHRDLWRGIVPEIVKGCTIIYQDIGAEKCVDSDLARRGLLAIAAYYKDRRAKLTPEEVRAALNLNEWLREYEKTLLAKLLSIEEELKNGLRGNDPFLVDYEIDLKLDFYLREDDPFYDNEEANKYDCDSHSALMCIMKYIDYHEGVISTPNYRGLGDDQDHSNICNIEHSDPVYRVKHCTLFRELIDHSHVPLNHLGRIGMIWANIEVQYQNMVDIDLSGERIVVRQEDTWQGKLKEHD